MTLKRKLVAALTLACLLVCLPVSVALAAAQNYHMERNDYIAYLKKHVDSDVMERWRGDVSMQNMADILRYLDVFEYWTEMAAEGQRHKLAEKELALLDAFKAKISAAQSEAFPKLRQVLAGLPVAEFGKADVESRVEGDRYRTAVFSGRGFMESDRSSFFDENLTRLLQSLRFDKALHEIADNNGSRTETLELTSFADDELAVYNPATGKYKQVK